MVGRRHPVFHETLDDGPGEVREDQRHEGAYGHNLDRLLGDAGEVEECPSVLVPALLQQGISGAVGLAVELLRVWRVSQQTRQGAHPQGIDRVHQHVLEMKNVSGKYLMVVAPQRLVGPVNLLQSGDEPLIGKLGESQGFVVFGRAVRPRLFRLNDRDQSVVVGVPGPSEPPVEIGQHRQGRLPELLIAGGPVNPFHGVGDDGRLHGGTVMGVGLPDDIAAQEIGLLLHLPEDDMGHEAVGQGPAHQGPQFGLGLVRVKVEQGDSVEAGVPEPLEGIAGEGGADEAVFLAVPIGHALAQVGQQYPARAFFQCFSVHVSPGLRPRYGWAGRLPDTSRPPPAT